MENLGSLVSHQMEELRMAETLESDHDLAFRLQMEEALAVSASSVASTSRAPTPLSVVSVGDEKAPLWRLQIDELERFQQERADREQTVAAARKSYDDSQLWLHDKEFARQIKDMPDEEWDNDGDFFERPFGAAEGSDVPFRLFFKGMVSLERVDGAWVSLSAVGVAICDGDDNLLLEMKKPTGVCSSRAVVEAKALIEGLTAALELGLKRIMILCDFVPIYNFIIRRWRAKQRKIANMVDQINQLTRKFQRCEITLLPRVHVKYVFMFARQAIDVQLEKIGATSEHVGNSSTKDVKENCSICLEDKDILQIFSVDGCSHRFCFSCMQQHVDVKLHQGLLPTCPHLGCKSKLTVENCRKFLSPKLLETLSRRVEEASIPETDKLYCPYEKCSALMSRKEMLKPEQASSSHGTRNGSGFRRCIKCQLPFCIYCKVPWHAKLSCQQYKLSHPVEDVKLQSLANKNLWRQCVKCNHMIELAEGCYHMTCRCGYEFCYTCGAEYVRKKPTCACPLWDEHNIIRENDDDDYDDESDEYHDDFDEYSSDSDYEDTVNFGAWHNFANLRH
ncbi:E3 ubiquitin-protein ligase RSL1-like [Nymphaea colorata]|nr:E3 ubiquitin-protein ligase RSL1-like [Nymphaea colorata]